MNKEPEISIVVPIYNCDKFLRGCLQSVLDQTFDSYEVLMVNNRSTDSSEQIAREFEKKDSRFRLIQCKSGLAGSTRNIGIHAARGKYLAFLDGDDKLLPDYMKKQPCQYRLRYRCRVFRKHFSHRAGYLLRCRKLLKR